MTAGNTVNVKVNEKASAGSKPLVAQKFFFELLKKDVHEFYEKIKGIRDAKDLKVFVDDQLEISKTNSIASRDESEALPLSVWIHRGFEREAILKCPSETRPNSDIVTGCL